MTVDIRAALEISGWMKPEELRWLAERAAGKATVVEIGSWRGRSTRALCDHAAGTVYAIDTWAGDPRDEGKTTTRAHYQEYAEIGSDGAYAAFLARHAEHIASGRLVPIQAPSAEGCARLLREIGRTVDLAFIDGCHVYEAVREDIESCRALVRPGGILAGHDYLHRGHPGVKQAVDEAFGGRHRLHAAIWWTEAPA